MRNFKNTKLRLKTQLNESRRSEITRLLLRKVIRACEASRAVSEVVIVATNPIQARSAVRGLSKCYVVREPLRHGGVNLAMEKGINTILKSLKRKKIRARMILLMPSDLPFLTSRALDRAAATLQDYDLLIGPSDRLDGTNLLGLNYSDAKKRIELHYDDDSFRKHCEEASSLGLKYKVIREIDFSFDLDTKEDLFKLMKMLKTKNIDDLFQRLAEGYRIKQQV